LGHARGSKGEYTTAYGISVYPEPTEDLQSPLPDPCLALSEHSMEATAVASAVLRRHRLMRSACKIASGRLSLSQLEEVFHSPFLRKSMNALPAWWCPWIHDAALLVHACTRGLFAILRDRTEDDPSFLFSLERISQNMKTQFDTNEGLFPPSGEVEESEKVEWIDLQAREFPSACVLERRLAFICAKASESFGDEYRYDNIPMFDHGAWPRN